MQSRASQAKDRLSPVSIDGCTHSARFVASFSVPCARGNPERDGDSGAEACNPPLAAAHLCLVGYSLQVRRLLVALALLLPVFGLPV